MSMQELFAKGGLVMWPILGCSVLALALVLDKVVRLVRQRQDPTLLAAVLERVGGGQLDEARRRCQDAAEPLGRVLAAGLSAWGEPHEEIDRRLEQAAADELHALEQRLPLLATLIAVLPMLGFLGTIWGLIGAFRSWEAAGANVTVESLAGGIYAAMITTAAGLVTSIPYVVAYNLLTAKTSELARRLNVGGSELSARHRAAQPSVARRGGAA